MKVGGQSNDESYYGELGGWRKSLFVVDAFDMVETSGDQPCFATDRVSVTIFLGRILDPFA